MVTLALNAKAYTPGQFIDLQAFNVLKDILRDTFMIWKEIYN